VRSHESSGSIRGKGRGLKPFVQVNCQTWFLLERDLTLWDIGRSQSSSQGHKAAPLQVMSGSLGN